MTKLYDDLIDDNIIGVCNSNMPGNMFLSLYFILCIVENGDLFDTILQVHTA